jgi:ribosome-associated translation inhibitor RaiA
MVIDTRALGFRLTDAILSHVEGRVDAALGFAARRVVRVTVRLDDVNGDHGGPDKRCRVVVTLRHHRTVTVEDVGADLYAAVDAAAHKARHAVLREVKRHVARARRDAQRPGTLVPA